MKKTATKKNQSAGAAALDVQAPTPTDSGTNSAEIAGNTLVDTLDQMTSILSSYTPTTRDQELWKTFLLEQFDAWKKKSQ